MRAGYRSEKGRFAGSVGAYQSNCLSLIDLKADRTHGLQQSVPDIESIDRKQTHLMPPPK